MVTIASFEVDMFDATIVKQNRTEYIPYEKTVTEIKAPTDDSIKLLNEFKTKALEDTMLLFEVKNTEFHFVGRYIEHVGSYDKYAVIKFRFNGKEITKEVKLNQGLMSTREYVVSFMIEKYKEMIANLVGELVIKHTITEHINKLDKNK